jgi:NAD(P)-dependent dehydrogenase (short-subunit alcohol dehydrogenase family)
LLLDEMFPPVIAERLIAAGHDVVAVTGRPELIGLDDAELLAQADALGRAIVTENAADFIPLFREAVARGPVRCGLVLTSNRYFSRHQGRNIGRLVRALAALCAGNPGDDATVGVVVWLRQPP